MASPNTIDQAGTSAQAGASAQAGTSAQAGEGEGCADSPDPQGAASRHGGNRIASAARLGCRPSELLDASASLVPFGPPARLRWRLLREALCVGGAVRDYPDRDAVALRQAIAACHGLDPERVLPGNGAAELFTWAARDAAACGVSLLPQPGFADYARALACWQAPWRALRLPLAWHAAWPQPFPLAEVDVLDQTSAGADPKGPTGPARVLWITNPHNPTGQLWSRDSLAAWLPRFALVIVDEAFLPLVPGGEAQSLLPLLADQPNLVVIRSLTKLCAIAGLRLGYALGQPERLRRWARWRDPWPINGLASAAGLALMEHPASLERWQGRVAQWVAEEGAWLASGLDALPGLEPQASACNFLLVRGRQGDQPVSLEPLRLALEQRHRILLRDCRSFAGLDASWLRIGLQDRRGNRRVLGALRREHMLLERPRS
jgi:histidinol-phosphate/aromatic aminotransferase/cobyric acid decarboxylase-like protein